MRDLVLGLNFAFANGKATDDVLVLAGESLFNRGFDLGSILDFQKEKAGNLLLYYTMASAEEASGRGVVQLDQHTKRVTAFYEKPTLGMTASRLGSPLFYILTPECVELAREFITLHPGQSKASSN
jgi:NDP-sugar pyrophosphorylase family protein